VDHDIRLNFRHSNYLQRGIVYVAHEIFESFQPIKSQLGQCASRPIWLRVYSGVVVLERIFAFERRADLLLMKKMSGQVRTTLH
jgi:hypothetical protein